MAEKRRKPTGPHAVAVEKAFAYLRGHTYRRVPTDQPTAGLNLGQLEVRLTAAMLRDQAGGSAVPDGYPGGSSEGGGTPSDVKLTPVEAVADQRAYGRRQHDPVHEHTQRAVRSVLAAAEAMHTAEAALAALERLNDDAPVVALVCEVCDSHGLTAPRPIERRTTVGNRLEKMTDLCQPHISYVERNGELPTPEQTRHHDATGTWRVRVAG